jgi:hypothetical protein
MSSIYTKDFYVYAYLRNDGTPYYIGKGSGKRSHSKNHTINLPDDKTKIIIMESILTEIGAFALERFYIRWYGRKNINTGILRNLTDGGEGGSGLCFSISHRQKISDSLTGRTFSKIHRKNISLSKQGKQTWLGKSHTIESKEKISNSKKGLVVSKETRDKIASSMLGKKIHNNDFKEHRKKIMTENNPSKLFRISCCHCGKQMSKSNHTKWHGEKCKLYLSRLQSGT